MIATLSRSPSFEVSAPRFVNAGMLDTSTSSSGRWRGQIGPATTRQQAAFLVEDLGFGNRELLSEIHDLAADRQNAGHRGPVIVDTQIDRRNAAAGLGDHGPIGGEVHQCGENAAVSVATVRIDDPLLAPVCRQFDGALADCNHLEAEPLVVGTTGQQLLDVFDAGNFTHYTRPFYLRLSYVKPLTVRPRPCR